MRKKRKPPPPARVAGASDRSAAGAKGQRVGSENILTGAGEQQKHRAFWPGREPFTVANVRETLCDVLKDQTTMPSEAALRTLAAALNDIHGAFWWRKTTLPESDSQDARANRVCDAIQTLMCFFDQRSQAWRGAPAEVVDRERQLYDRFRDFVQAMTAHDFLLGMDRDDAALMPRLENWHHVAEGVVAGFRLAMHPVKLGSSNEGPVARFVAAVMPLMTGDHPTASAVSQHLKRQKRRARGRSY
jgi:hypothetical protein